LLDIIKQDKERQVVVKCGEFLNQPSKLSASQEAFLSFQFNVKQRTHHTTNREVLTQSQGGTKSCIAVRSSAALTGWPADEGFLCDRAAVGGTG
jgi:hypothetical protein